MSRGRHCGFTLVEMVVFIVIIGAAAVGLMSVMRAVMPRSFTGGINTQATQLAQMRMELVLGQKDTDMYQYMSDPCSGGSPNATLCSSPLGYTVSVSGIASANNWTTLTSAALRVVTVKVSNSSGTILASISSVVSNY